MPVLRYRILMSTVLLFIIALGILVLVHEWGHFIVAKKSGVRVDVFSIGFGPKILGFTWGGTDYRVAPIPLGGYVKIFGQDPLEEANGDAAVAAAIASHPQAFYSKKLWQKLATVMAGPVMNLVLCFLVMPIVFMIGRMQPKVYDEPPVIIDIERDSPAAKSDLQKGDLITAFDGAPIATWQDLITQIALHPDQSVALTVNRHGALVNSKADIIQNPGIKQSSGYLGIEPAAFVGNDPVIDAVNPGSPAEKAGFQPGDRITQINGENIQYWTDLTERVQKSSGAPLALVVDRAGTAVTLNATAVFKDDVGAWILGLTKRANEKDFVKKQHGFAEAFVLGAQENVKLFKMTLDVLGRLVTGGLSVKSLGGPIQIAQATSVAAKSGFGDFLYLMAFLSLQLGVMNLLPIPVLDGGHVVFILVEAIMRKPLAPRIRHVSMQLGMFMLLTLMVVVTINDVENVWGFSNIVQSIRNIF